MSMNDCRLTIAFSKDESCERVHKLFGLLEPQSMSQFNAEMATLGVKTKLKPESIHAFDLRSAGGVLQASFSLEPDLRFPKPILKALPDATLIVMAVEDDSESGSKSAFLYHGKSIAKAALYDELDSLDKRLAFSLSPHMGIRAVTKYIKALENLNEVYAGAPLFWRLIPFVGESKKIQDLIDECDFSARSVQGDTVLHEAARQFGSCSEQALEWLIKRGCDVNALNVEGDTPLSVALRLAGTPRGAASMLLRHQADPNIVNAKGCAPIHDMCQQGDEDGINQLIFRKADFNLKSPLGSPLWIANKANRTVARRALWRRDCQLIAADGAYGGAPYENLLTAIHHHDVAAMDRCLSALTLTDDQVHQLYCHAFHYQCGDVFDRLRAASSWRPAANTRDIVYCEKNSATGSDRYLLETLSLQKDRQHHKRYKKLDFSDGDSYRLFTTVLEDSSESEIDEISTTDKFATNCRHVVESRMEQALEFFQLLKRKGVALDRIFEKINHLGWVSRDDVPKDAVEVLTQLRSLGLVFHGSEPSLLKVGFKQPFVSQICLKGSEP